MEQQDHDRHRGPQLLHDELPEEHEDPLIQRLHLIIRQAIKVLAVLMVW